MVKTLQANISLVKRHDPTDARRLDGEFSTFLKNPEKRRYLRPASRIKRVIVLNAQNLRCSSVQKVRTSLARCRKWLDRVSAVAEEEIEYAQMSSLTLWPGSTRDIVKECFFQDVQVFGQTE